MKNPAKPENGEKYKEFVIRINRCATVVKGGRRFCFSALVVIGDQQGKVGIGFGKANEVPQAVQKAVNDAHKALVTIPLSKGTIPHQVIGKYRATKVLLKPAPPGTGVIAGSTVRAVVESLGIKDIYTKALGCTNAVNLSKAALNGLLQIRSFQEVMNLRGLPLPAKQEPTV